MYYLEGFECTIRFEKQVINCNWVALGGPYQLEYEVIQMFLKLAAECLQFRYGIIELDVPESKKSNQYLLFKNLEVTLILRKLKQGNLVTFSIFKIYTDFLVNLLKL